MPLQKEQFNNWRVTAAILVLGIGAVLAMGWVVSGWPTVYTTEVSDFFPRGRASFPREYDMAVYHVFIGLVLGLTAAAVFWGRQMAGFLKIAAFIVAAAGWATFNKIVNGSVFSLGWNTQVFWPAHVPPVPYFFPLRYGGAAVFTLSFIIPVFYAACACAAFERKAWRSVLLSVTGLGLFFVYIRYPFPGPLLLVSMPGVLMGLSWALEKTWPRPSMRVMGAVLGGAQAMLLCVWLQEHLKKTMVPSDFAMAMYAVFAATALLIYAVLALRRMSVSYSFLMLQVVLIALMAMAWFKLIVYDYRGDLARFWFNALGLLTLAQPLMWTFGRRVYPSLVSWYSRIQARWGVWPMDVLVLGLIALAVYVPDIEALTAHIFLGEYFHHTDHYAMAPVWSMANGGLPNIDARSQYGIGSVVVFGWLMKALGGISYTHFFAAMVGMCTVYFMLMYVFLSRLLGSRWLAVACWLVVFKAYIAFELAYPIVYTYPQTTVSRQFFDVVWMLLMLKFLDGGQKRWLMAASAVAGFALWYISSTGFYLCAANVLIAALAAWRAKQGRWQLWLQASGLLALTAFVLYAVLYGRWLFSPVLWRNLGDFLHLFMFTASSPLMTVLAQKQFVNAFMFCLMVLVYAGTLVKTVLDFLTGKGERRDWLAMGLAVYGLGSLEHYLVLSAGNNYYGKSLPFFALAFYWLSRSLPFFSELWKGRFLSALTVAAFIALVTNHSYMSYPNALNVSQNPWVDFRVARPLPDGRAYFYHKHRFTPMPRFEVNSLGETDERLITEFDFKTDRDLVAYYHEASDFSADAAFIDGLTKPGEHVPLVSSNEVMILMQANRPPFFYLYPLVETRPMRVRTFSSDLMQTHEHLRLTLAQLEDKKPPTVFIEKIMLAEPQGAARAWYEENTPGLMALKEYLKEHYEPFAQGQFLAALKRKPS